MSDIVSPPCRCGCGLPVSRDRRGRPQRYVAGHQARRFRYAVDENGCWIWQGIRDAAGYGLLMRDRRHRLAHRVSWEFARGPIPAGLVIDHLCGVASCVNPEHLEPVTQAENVRRGGLAKLTVDHVRAIRREVAAGALQEDTARRYGVGRTTISNIVARRAWVDVDGGQ